MKYYIITFSLLLFFSINTTFSFADTNENIIKLEENAIKMIQESNFERALEYLDQILAIEPTNTNALNNKGGVLIELENFTAAIDHYDHVLKINEKNTEALNNKAIALSKNGNYTQSLTYFHKSLLTDSSNQNTINNTRYLVNQLYWIDESERSYGTIAIRDQNNNLVGYSKINSINIQPPLGYIYLKNHGEITDVLINDKLTKVLKFEASEQLDKTQFIGRIDISMKINDFEIKVVELELNGLIGVLNDQVDYSLTIVDPLY